MSFFSGSKLSAHAMQDIELSAKNDRLKWTN